MSRTRTRFTAQQKADLVRRHVVKKEAISDLADEIGLQPSQIHLWINQVLEQAERAFIPNGKSRIAANSDKHRIKALAVLTRQGSGGLIGWSLGNRKGARTTAHYSVSGDSAA